MADKLFGRVSVAFVRVSWPTCGLRRMASIRITGVSRSVYLHGMVKLRHRTKIRGLGIPRVRCFLVMSTVLSCSGGRARSVSSVSRPLFALGASYGFKLNDDVGWKGADGS